MDKWKGFTLSSSVIYLLDASSHLMCIFVRSTVSDGQIRKYSVYSIISLKLHVEQLVLTPSLFYVPFVLKHPLDSLKVAFEYIRTGMHRPQRQLKRRLLFMGILVVAV